MNFYNNKLTGKKYLSILKKYNKNFSKEFIVQNFGAFIGDRSFYRWIVCYNFLNKTKKIKGDIAEFGVWNGNNLLTLKKISDFFKLKKKVVGYDHFRGMPKTKQKNDFKGDKNFIKYIINFYKLNNIKIINDDMMNLKKHIKHFTKLSFIYIDCDLYETTAEVLNLLNTKLSVGGIIAFDEGNQTINSGEGKAVNEFYKKNRKKYKRVLLNKNYQPDIYLLKIR